jgi:outer membrane protein assembly factor BamB
MTTGPTDRTETRNMIWHAAVRTAAVAGVFCLVVGGVLAWHVMAARQSDPLDNEQLQWLRTQLAERPDDAALIARAREVDLELRREFFRRQRIVNMGIGLLAGGAVVLLAAAAVAVWARRPDPHPGEGGGGAGWEMRSARRAQWTVGAVAATIIGGAVALAVVAAGNRPDGTDISAADRDDGPPVGPAATEPAPDPAQVHPWPAFRGPGGLGVWTGPEVPVEWDVASGKNVRWTIDLPLAGYSSPIVWGDRLFLTGADAKTREVLCYDAESGELLWRKAVKPELSPEEPPAVFDDDPGIYAAPTPVADAEHVVAAFANGDMACFAHDGKLLWSEALGPLEDMYGHASSLVLAGDKVIVQLDQGMTPDEMLSNITAVRIGSGEYAWTTPRPVAGSWSSPIVIEAGGARQVIAIGDPLMIAHDAAGGKPIWRVRAFGPDQAPTPIFAGGLVIAAASGPSGAEALAVRPDGRGDVTETHVAWKVEEGVPEISSPLSDGKRVFLASDWLTCYQVKTGRKLWVHQFEDALFEASPSLAGGRLYLLDKRGTMYVGTADDEGFTQTAVNRLGEKHVVSASPAFAPGRIYIRARVLVGETEDGYDIFKHRLYCIGKAR